jgi:hypothetical protein
MNQQKRRQELARRERFYIRVMQVLLILLVVYLCIPARAADRDVNFITEYPLEYCATVTVWASDHPTVLALGSTRQGRLYQEAKDAYLGVYLDEDALRLIAMKVGQLEQDGVIDQDDILADAYRCVKEMLIYWNKESNDE